MSIRKHHDGEQKAGTHTSVIEAADPAIKAIKKMYPEARIQNGHILGNVKARGNSIKITMQLGCTLLVVVSKATKQEFRIYGEIILLELHTCLSSDKKLLGYSIRTAKT